VYFFLPALDRLPYETLSAWLPLCVSLVAYAFVASLWLQGRSSLGDKNADLDGVEHVEVRDGRHMKPRVLPQSPRWSRIWEPYRHYFLPRGLFLLVSLVLIMFGLSFADGVSELYASSFKAHASQARVMTLSFFLLVWIIVTYLYFLVPALNLELQQRQLDRTITNFSIGMKKHPSRLPIVLYAVAAISVIFVLILWWL